jgi:K(+)-stimulated pyrophosphate-energized sodium pump
MNTIMIYLPLPWHLLDWHLCLLGMGFKTRSGDGKMKRFQITFTKGLGFQKAEYRLLTFFVIGASVF